MLAIVRRNQFVAVGMLEVVHEPTGATFWTYWYPPGTDFSAVVVHEQLGRAGERLPNGADYSPAEIRFVAHGLLRELATSNNRSATSLDHLGQM